ncbi:hypothetical protein [Aquiflexum gelatinilyticum]|uniref:Lipocalin-like domain-containing protein n=1 Tax=Aquiflexum gelatinilyticum TaxID=2961943 RepID=A0A9X2P6D9_9BACT|nr:hypothetical protein [Aquiflexum gelatinilyticum]MCR9016976.1 hypothetical protein [Aquiflexum gelatinilyticum]MCS4433827.1 hypothetical protein [Aquiflexum gelatinilyticum]
MKKSFPMLAICFLLLSCIEQETLELESGEFPLGTWTNIQFEETGFTMDRSSKLPENTYGYVFQKNGKLIHRANSGFCGTPPIVTADFAGKWTLKGDIVEVEVNFWGGKYRQEWKVTQLSGKTVKVELLKQEYFND